MKEEVDAIERGREEESKVFLANNIEFDFGVLIRIKELMVDLSSSCVEMVLKVYKKFLYSLLCLVIMLAPMAVAFLYMKWLVELTITISNNL